MFYLHIFLLSVAQYISTTMTTLMQHLALCFLKQVHYFEGTVMDSVQCRLTHFL